MKLGGLFIRQHMLNSEKRKPIGNKIRYFNAVMLSWNWQLAAHQWVN